MIVAKPEEIWMCNYLDKQITRPGRTKNGAPIHGAHRGRGARGTSQSKHDHRQGNTRIRYQGPRGHPRHPQSSATRHRSQTQVALPFTDIPLTAPRNSKDPAAAVRRHIRLLHEYNEIRDVALNFVGKIAEKERCRTIDVLRDYGMDEKD